MDEFTPLLRAISNEDITDAQKDEALNDIEFDSDTDPDNPLNWPNSYRWGVILLLAFVAFTVTFTCMGVVPVAARIVFDLEGKESKSSTVLLVTIWELGEAAGPLLIAPLSEVYGRYPVFNCANVLFIFWTVVAASSHTSGLFIFSRFMTGCAVASNVLNPAIIGDILPPEQRGTAMATLMLAPLLGGAIGPALAGFIASSIGWRRVLWIAALIAAVCEIAFLLLLRETYKLSILKRRAIQRGDIPKSSMDPEKESATVTIWRCIKRPGAVFAGSFVLQIMSLYSALIFTFFYIMATTLPPILGDIYDFGPTLCGSAFMSFSIGSTVGIVVCNLTLDRIYIKLKKSNNGIGQPEHRMPIVIASAFFFPAAVALFGWTAQKQWPVAILLFSLGLLGFFMLTAMVPTMAYVVDGFGVYSASALTAVLVTRCLMSTFLPLTTIPLTDALGYGCGYSILAAACLVVAPIPLFVMRYGKRWRQHSFYSKDT